MKTFEEYIFEIAAEKGHSEEYIESKASRSLMVLLGEEAAKRLANEAAKGYFNFRPVDEWHEDMGTCLFYAVPVCEPPTVTSPISSDWVDDYFTHFLEMRKFPVPDEYGGAIPGNSRDKYWTPFPEEK